MSLLQNPRHERFAQEYAKGKNGRESYLAAGYDCTPEAADVGASKLLRQVKVLERVTELQQRGADRAEITLSSLLEDAERIQRGAETSEQWSAANSALQTKAKLAGKWIDRSEVGQPGEFDRMADDELFAAIRKDAAELGLAAPKKLNGRNGTAH